MKYNYQFNVLRYLVLLFILAIFSNARLKAQGLNTNTTYVVNGATDFTLPLDTFVNLTGPAGALTYLNSFGMNSVQSSTGPVIFLLSTGYNPVEPMC